MLLIDNQIELEKISAIISGQKIVSIDTEFQRTSSYYAKLSLIQMVCGEHQIIIDVLAKLDLTPIRKLFSNSSILKVFHAPRQDFEILYNIFGFIPNNVFDTQIAAEVLGLGKSLSYSELCWQICGVKLDKKNQFSNWLKRPVDAEKLDYAINDVLYLAKIYEMLQDKIRQNNLENLYEQKLSQLLSLNNYKFDSSIAWKKIRFQNSSTKLKKYMQEIAAFREEHARNLDVPRRHFLTDEELIAICKSLPTNEQELKKLNIRSSHFKKNRLNIRLQEICLALKEDI